ncbi:MAG TPA: hypothetical protein VK982_11815, partial [Bacteroidales bacterium]|nr:hypothetical protein [Bacteroidales bacterium]
RFFVDGVCPIVILEILRVNCGQQKTNLLIISLIGDCKVGMVRLLPVGGEDKRSISRPLL